MKRESCRIRERERESSLKIFCALKMSHRCQTFSSNSIPKSQIVDIERIREFTSFILLNVDFKRCFLFSIFVLNVGTTKVVKMTNL